MHLLASALLFGITVSVPAPDLSGHWEVQSMGTDREMEIQQQGDKIIAHRVMWPEFEGEKYRLEHLYRGTIAGTKISGDLLVREQGQKDYELLRTFAGELSASGALTIDSLPLKRLGGARVAKAAAPPTPATAKASAAASAAPAAPSAPTTPGSAAPPAATAPAKSDANLFDKIMGAPGSENLFRVSVAVSIPNAAAELAAAGDDLYAQEKYAEALAKYEEASKVEGADRATLLGRMGRAHLGLKQYHEAEQLLGRALRLDPQNRALRRDYERAKRRA